MSKWQPIETAPRDGTEIVLYHHDYNSLPLAWWDVVESDEGVGATWFCKDDTYGSMGDGVLWPDDDIMPSHWMPKPSLSDPPK